MEYHCNYIEGNNSYKYWPFLFYQLREREIKLQWVINRHPTYVSLKKYFAFSKMYSKSKILNLKLQFYFFKEICYSIQLIPLP